MKSKSKSKLLSYSALLGFLAYSGWAHDAHAFPANTRLGYSNCQACHISPTGGGAVNAYGASTANEISTWAPFNDPSRDPGASKYIVGGDVRHIWVKTDSPNLQYENRFLMQTDFELGLTLAGLTGVVQFGQYHGEPNDQQGSYRHYLMYQHRKHSLRVGKFAPVFGLNDPDHNLPGRNSLGFDNRGATYNVEYVYAAKRWAVNLTGVLGCPGGYLLDSPTPYCQETGYLGFTGQGTWSPNKIVTAYFSYAYLSKAVLEAEEPADTRLILAGSWVIGTKNIYTLGEITQENRTTVEDTTHQGWADFMVAPYRGVAVGYAMKLYQGNRKQYGVKAGWLPMTGLEFNFSWMREFSKDANADSFLFLSHAYL